MKNCTAGWQKPHLRLQGSHLAWLMNRGRMFPLPRPRIAVLAQETEFVGTAKGTASSELPACPGKSGQGGSREEGRAGDSPSLPHFGLSDESATSRPAPAARKGHQGASWACSLDGQLGLPPSPWKPKHTHTQLSRPPKQPFVAAAAARSGKTEPSTIALCGFPAGRRLLPSQVRLTAGQRVGGVNQAKRGAPWLADSSRHVPSTETGEAVTGKSCLQGKNCKRRPL